MMKIDKPGVYKLSHEEYHADPCAIPALTRSTIRDLLFKSPAHAWHNHPRLNPNFKPDDGNGKFDLGSVAHDLLLEGLDCCAIVDAEDWRSKAAKEAREIARLEGKTPLLKHQYEEALLMVKAAEKQIYACKELGIKNLKAEGDIELSYFWQEDGLWFKVRPDWIRKDRLLILDYKTTGQSANPSDISRHIISMSYDIQAALYTRGVKAIAEVEPKFIFIFQEVEEPYFCSFVGLPPDFMDMGASKVDYGKFMWGQCMGSDEWPGYPNQVCWIDNPPWAMSSWDARAAEIGM